MTVTMLRETVSFCLFLLVCVHSISAKPSPGDLVGPVDQLCSFDRTCPPGQVLNRCGHACPPRCLTVGCDPVPFCLCQCECTGGKVLNPLTGQCIDSIHCPSPFDPWPNPSPLCTGGRVYNQCTRGCPPKCLEFPLHPCDPLKECVPGCECPQGTFWSSASKKCVIKCPPIAIPDY